ncbi:hypothetical protein WA026_014712 [Henosepilachna vigintioctopunctata]|uniref:Uncharacterized protein n=1 Tax=Henosepilachna vigintioctopunctata TaxID=420089 RepID=A0AAW1V703_9CUCU
MPLPTIPCHKGKRAKFSYFNVALTQLASIASFQGRRDFAECFINNNSAFASVFAKSGSPKTAHLWFVNGHSKQDFHNVADTFALSRFYGRVPVESKCRRRIDVASADIHNGDRCEHRLMVYAGQSKGQ